MERIFIRPVGRYKSGDVRDYPANTWAQIAKNAGQRLDLITRPVLEAATETVAVAAGGKRK